MGATHVENVVDLACRTALSYRGVAHITIPVDFQEQELKDSKRSTRNVPHHTSDICTPLPLLPRESYLHDAAAILNAGKKIAILTGQGALGAGDEVQQVAELLGAPIIKALLGKAVVPDDSPYTTGGIGLLGTRPSQEAMEDCDTLLIVGSAFPYIEFLPKPGEAKGVQIDLNPQQIGLRFPVEVGLVGATYSSEGGTDAFRLWQFGQHGVWIALRVGSADCLSRTSVRRLRRRRRIFDAHGGFRYCGEISPAHQGGDYQEQCPGSDQV